MSEFEFPGENTYLLKKDGVAVYEEPMLKIGEKCTCMVIKSTPMELSLVITHINERKTSVKYKATLRLQDFRICVENIFLDDFYKRGDTFDALIISFGDLLGCYVSTMSDGLGIVKE